MEESLKTMLNNPQMLLQTFLFFVPALIISCWGLKQCLNKISSKTKFEEGAWGIIEVVLGIGFFVFVTITVQLVFRQFVSQQDLEENIIWALLITTISQILVCLFIIALVKQILHGSWKTLGLEKRNISKNKMKWAAISYVSFLPIYFFVIFISYISFSYMGWELEEQDLVKQIKMMDKNILVYVIAFCATIVIPVCEEFFFRVFIYTRLRSLMGVYLAAIVSAAFFSAVHGNLLGFLPIMALGFWFALLYEKTQSLWVPSCVHALHNGFTIGILLFS